MKHNHMKLFLSPEKNYSRPMEGGHGLGGPPGSATAHPVWNNHSTLKTASQSVLMLIIQHILIALLLHMIWLTVLRITRYHSNSTLKLTALSVVFLSDVPHFDASSSTHFTLAQIVDAIVTTDRHHGDVISGNGFVALHITLTARRAAVGWSNAPGTEAAAVTVARVTWCCETISVYRSFKE